MKGGEKPMAYTVISQHTYRDKKRLFVTMVSVGTSFDNVNTDINNYISQFNNDSSDYTISYSDILSLNTYRVRDYIDAKPPITGDGAKGSFITSFVVLLT